MYSVFNEEFSALDEKEKEFMLLLAEPEIINTEINEGLNILNSNTLSNIRHAREVVNFAFRKIKDLIIFSKRETPYSQIIFPEISDKTTTGNAKVFSGEIINIQNGTSSADLMPEISKTDNIIISNDRTLPYLFNGKDLEINYNDSTLNRLIRIKKAPDVKVSAVKFLMDSPRKVSISIIENGLYVVVYEKVVSSVDYVFETGPVEAIIDVNVPIQGESKFGKLILKNFIFAGNFNVESEVYSDIRVEVDKELEGYMVEYCEDGEVSYYTRSSIDQEWKESRNKLMRPVGISKSLSLVLSPTSVQVLNGKLASKYLIPFTGEEINSNDWFIFSSKDEIDNSNIIPGYYKAIWILDKDTLIDTDGNAIILNKEIKTGAVLLREGVNEIYIDSNVPIPYNKKNYTIISYDYENGVVKLKSKSSGAESQINIGQNIYALIDSKSQEMYGKDHKVEIDNFGNFKVSDQSSEVIYLRYLPRKSYVEWVDVRVLFDGSNPKDKVYKIGLKTF